MSIESRNTDNLSVSGRRDRKNRLNIMPLLFLVGIFVLLLSGCKDSPSNANPDNEKDQEETEATVLDDGEVGLVIDARAIARKGYQPTTVSVEFTGEYSEFSQDITVNPNTSVATLSISAEDVTEEKLTQMSEGIEATVTVMNNSSEELASVVDQFQVDDSNRFVPIKTEKARIYPQVNIVDGEPYFLQVKSDNEVYNNRLLYNSSYGFPYNYLDEELGVFCRRDFYHSAVTLNPSEDTINKTTNSFYFEHISKDYYYIYILESDGNKKYMKKSTSEGKLLVFVDSDDPVNEDPFKFKVEQGNDGLVTITSKSKGKALGYPNLVEQQPCRYTADPIDDVIAAAGDLKDGLIGIAQSEEDVYRFRMVAADINWAVEERGVEYNAPIIPRAQLNFAHESTLKNCSGGTTLNETVGRTETEENSFTMGTTESLQLYSSSSASIDVTTGVETGVEMFGAGVTASFEVSSSYTYTTSSTQTRSKTWEETTTESVEISSERTVEIEPNTAVKVSDVYQAVEDIKMPFVQTLRVSATDGDGNELTGTEIHSQLIASRFGGVVKRVEDNYVELTVRGTANINKFVKAERWVEEIENGCE